MEHFDNAGSRPGCNPTLAFCDDKNCEATILSTLSQWPRLLLCEAIDPLRFVVNTMGNMYLYGLAQFVH